jgi:hypothetical protein
MTQSPDPLQSGPVPDADRVPGVDPTPRQELLTEGRNLDDIYPLDRSPIHRGGVRHPVLWMALLLVLLLAFVGWLLVGPPFER